MPYSLTGNADGRVLSRNASESDAREIAKNVFEATGESLTMTDLDTGEETILFAADEEPKPKGKAKK